VAVVTSSRADYATCRSIVRALATAESVEPRYLVTGTHLVPEWGHTVDEIEADGDAAFEQLEGYAGATPEGGARSVGLAAASFAGSFGAAPPDVLVIVGDRLELLGVAAAALPFHVPVAHVSGGEETGGAIDNVVRKALTKLAHLHFVAMPDYADQVAALGEERWRITVTGDPGLDDVVGPWPPVEDLADELGHAIRRPLVAVGFHPATLSRTSPEEESDALLAALDDIEGTLVFTYPGADAGAEAVIERIEAFAVRHPNAVVRRSLGRARYHTLLAHADLLIGNSSSGIWEAPSFELPVVNVGERQAGRVRAANVIDASAERDAIAAAIARALDPAFRRGLGGLANPYGDGHAGARIAAVLQDVELGPALLAKRSGSPAPA
jgi:UDP-hydrolysing UDP-N-acetyl-D-glucosamine 2-epimerase